MKVKTVKFRLFFIFFIAASSIYAQQINPKIQEVYGDKTEEFVQNEPERIKMFADLLRDRLTVVEINSHEKETYPKLSQMPLLNKYNTNLKRDVVFDVNTFNPLKYNLNFFSNKKEVYRIDNTNYLIVINPQSFK